MRTASLSLLLAVLTLSGSAPAETPAAAPPAASAPAAAPPPAAPAADSAPAPIADTPPAVQTADEAFSTRVKTLEEQVVDLKEKIFRSKARLLLLQESVLGGDLATGSRAVLVHRKEMGSSFVLESVAYALDGAPVFAKADENGDLDKHEELEIFNGRILPGQHQIAARLVYRGHGYGVFSYLEGYKFKVQSSYTFNAEPGKVTRIKIVGFEKGGVTTNLKDRPAVRYDVEVNRDTGTKRPGTSSPVSSSDPQP